MRRSGGTQEAEEPEERSSELQSPLWRERSLGLYTETSPGLVPRDEAPCLKPKGPEGGVSVNRADLGARLSGSRLGAGAGWPCCQEAPNRLETPATLPGAAWRARGECTDGGQQGPMRGLSPWGFCSVFI